MGHRRRCGDLEETLMSGTRAAEGLCGRGSKIMSAPLGLGTGGGKGVSGFQDNLNSGGARVRELSFRRADLALTICCRLTAQLRPELDEEWPLRAPHGR